MLPIHEISGSSGKWGLIGCRHLDAGLRIDVCDTGKGISSEHLDEISDEFYQIDNPARDRRSGMGPGLAIVKRLARLLNFDVEVSSVVGKGSRFSVLIPQDMVVSNRAGPDAVTSIDAATRTTD